MDPTLRAHLTRANDPERGIEDRAESAHKAFVAKGAEKVDFDLSAVVVAEIAGTWGPDEALAIALANTSSDRRAALEFAANLRRDQGQGDVPLTNALLELGRVSEALRSMIGEYGRLLKLDIIDPALLGAWGQHLVDVFAKLGKPEFKAFVYGVKDFDDDNARLVVDALYEAPVQGDEAKFRDRLLYRYDDYAVDWLIEREGV
jgi:hypothetical protein